MNKRIILDILKKYKRTSVYKNNITEIGIFGSFVKNKFTDSSDLDVFVVLKIPKPPDENGDEFILLQNVGPFPLIVYVGVAVGLVIARMAVVKSRKKRKERKKEIPHIPQQIPQTMDEKQLQSLVPNLSGFQPPPSPTPQHFSQRQSNEELIPIEDFEHPIVRKQCHNCKQEIEITSPKRPLVVVCPRCGKKYKVSK